MDEVSPQVMAQIREYVAALAERDYPRVWVGKASITADELLSLQDINDEGPEWLRVEPEELGGVSADWIEGPTALALIPDHFVENQLGNLQDEVGVIQAAKSDAVWVQRASTLGYAVGDELDTLSEDDRIFLRAAWFKHGGEPAAMFCSGFTYRMVPLEELSATDVDKYLLKTLEFYASGETWGPYVVEDTPQARALVRLRQG